MHIRENVHVHAHTKHITHIKCNTYQEVCVYAHENTHKHTLHCTVKHSIQTKKKLCVLFLNEISLRFSSSYYFFYNQKNHYQNLTQGYYYKSYLIISLFEY